MAGLLGIPSKHHWCWDLLAVLAAAIPLCMIPCSSIVDCAMKSNQGVPKASRKPSVSILVSSRSCLSNKYIYIFIYLLDI